MTADDFRNDPGEADQSFALFIGRVLADFPVQL